MLKTDDDKLRQAEEAITNLDWLEYVEIGGKPIVLHIDRRLLSRIGPFLEDGEMGVGKELASHYRKAIARHGSALQNPAQLELFLTFGRHPPLTVFLCTVNGGIYVSAEQLFPF